MGKILMPQMGFDMQEGKLVRWLKKPGDIVQRNEPVAEIETDKAVLEIEAYEGGTITSLLVEEGQVVPVGEPIAVLDGDETDGAAEADTAQETAEEAPAPTAPAQTDSKPAESAPAAAVDQTVSSEAATPQPPLAAVPAAAEAGPRERIKASPLARRLAREYGIDLGGITGSGPGGRIVKADVEAARAAASARPAAATAPAFAMPDGGRVEPLSRMREVIATRMGESKQQAPHFYISMSVDMGEALAFRKQFNETVGAASKASVNDLIVKACALALTQYPRVNAAFTPEGIRYHDTVDVAVAVALDGGLITPVVRECHTKSLDTIAVEARELITLARDGKLRPDQYQGGTFTVSNLGMYGVDDFIAIINPPQAAILAVGAAIETPVVRDGDIVVRPIMRITASADHRVTDGAEVAEFLQEVKSILEQPLRLLMPPRAKEESQ